MATRRDYYSWLFQALHYTVYVVVCLGKIANFCSFHLKLGHICTIFNMECMEWRPYSAYRKMNFAQNFDNGHKKGLSNVNVRLSFCKCKIGNLETLYSSMKNSGQEL